LFIPWFFSKFHELSIQFEDLMKLQELRLSIRNKLIDAAIIAASIFFIPALLISFKGIKTKRTYIVL